MKRRVIKCFLTVAVLCGLWELASRIPKYSIFIPSPLKVAGVFASNKSFDLLLPTITTLVVVLGCLTVGTLIGYTVGCAIGLSSRSKAVLYFPTTILKSVPISVFLPVFMAACGLDYYVYPMLCLPVAAMVAVNIANAVLEMPSERAFQRRVLNLTAFEYLKDIAFWETLECFFATLRIAGPFCLTLQVALDYFLHANGGLGTYISNQYQSVTYPEMYAAIMIVCAFGFLLLLSVDQLSRRLQRWRTRILN